MNKGDPRKLRSYENIKARVAYSDMHEFDKKPRKSYAIEICDMNQLDFPVNEMMFLTAQYKTVDQFKDKYDFIHMKLRFHAVLGKEQEEVWSLVKIVQVISITKDVFFENMLQKF